MPELKGLSSSLSKFGSSKPFMLCANFLLSFPGFSMDFSRLRRCFPTTRLNRFGLGAPKWRLDIQLTLTLHGGVLLHQIGLMRESDRLIGRHRTHGPIARHIDRLLHGRRTLLLLALVQSGRSGDDHRYHRWGNGTAWHQHFASRPMGECVSVVFEEFGIRQSALERPRGRAHNVDRLGRAVLHPHLSGHAVARLH